MEFTFKQKIYFFIFFIFIFFKFFFKIIVFYATKFETEITIKNKYIRPRRRGANYMVVDENDTLYMVNNLWFIGDFNRAEDWTKIKVGSKYKVKGYSGRVPALDIYPIIYNIK
tara:strand:- start:225 stop:563 length:339 start_codon:yes stop_codon:yes gene_type:complete